MIRDATISPVCWMMADLGTVAYPLSHQLQLDLVEARHSGQNDRDLLLLLEHPAVFTLGRRGGRSNLKISEAELQKMKMDIFPIERGGDITFHGPGQLVGYLLVSLKKNHLDISRLVFNIEEVMIKTACDFNLIAVRDRRNPGVWVNGEKLGNVGLAIRYGITFHGFALNVNNDLHPFDWINPCGLAGIKVTSLSALTGEPVGMPEVKCRVAGHVQDIFKVHLEPADFLSLAENVTVARGS